MKKWTWKVNVTAIAALAVGILALVLRDWMLMALAGILAYISQGD